MCFSSVSGFFAVICHGSDGHIAVEPVPHNHCRCPEPDERGNQDELGRSVVALSTDHKHCRDVPADSDVIFSVRKNEKTSTYKAIAAKLFVKSILGRTTSFTKCPCARCSEESSFFGPLRTIVLLA